MQICLFGPSRTPVPTKNIFVFLGTPPFPIHEEKKREQPKHRLFSLFCSLLKCCRVIPRLGVSRRTDGICFAVARIFACFSRRLVAGEAPAEYLDDLSPRQPSDTTSRQTVWRYHDPDFTGDLFSSALLKARWRVTAFSQ